MPLQAPEGYTDAEFASLSPQEQEALGVELDDKGPSRVVDDAEPVAAVAAVPVVAEPAAAAAAPAAAAAAPTAAVAAPAAPAPVADAIDPGVRTTVIKADRVVTDADHQAAQEALAKRFEDGEVSTPQFMVENDALTRSKMASDLAVATASQSEQQSWDAQQAAFFDTPGNAVIRDDPRVWAAMQAQLETMYADPANASKTNMQFLNEAGREVRKLFGIEAAAPVVAAAPAAAKPAASATPLPATLEGVPAAADTLDAGNEFAAIDKLEGMEYEFAVARLSKEQHAKYLAM